MTSYLVVIASLLSGYAAFRFSYLLAAMAQREVNTSPQAWDFDELRRQELRQKSKLYRYFEPLCREIEESAWLHRIGNLSSIEKSLGQGGSELPWTAREYLAVAVLRMLLSAIFSLCLVQFCLGEWIISLTIAGFVFIAGLAFVPRQLHGFAKVRMRRFKQRLPYAIDLLALMMEAGGDFRQCLGTVVRENINHPVGFEFGKLARAHAAGQPLRDCLDQLQSRLCDEDVNEIVFSIKNAEELGVPLSKTFLTLAEQMRLKHAQLAEKLIGERKTMMAFPSWIIMIACLIVAVAPFILGAIYGKQSFF